MPLTLKKLKSQSKTVVVPVGSETLTLEYNAACFTPRFRDRLRALTKDEEEATDGLLDMLEDLVLGWDLLEDDEVTPKPLTRDAWMDIPFEIITDAITKIMEELTPNSPRDQT